MLTAGRICRQTHSLAGKKYLPKLALVAMVANERVECNLVTVYSR